MKRRKEDKEKEKDERKEEDDEHPSLMILDPSRPILTGCQLNFSTTVGDVFCDPI
jgi:hypothetical protein